MLTPEQVARQHIDAAVEAAGGVIEATTEGETLISVEAEATQDGESANLTARTPSVRIGSSVRTVVLGTRDRTCRDAPPTILSDSRL